MEENMQTFVETPGQLCVDERDHENEFNTLTDLVATVLDAYGKIDTETLKGDFTAHEDYLFDRMKPLVLQLCDGIRCYHGCDAPHPAPHIPTAMRDAAIGLNMVTYSLGSVEAMMMSVPVRDAYAIIQTAAETLKIHPLLQTNKGHIDRTKVITNLNLLWLLEQLPDVTRTNLIEEYGGPHEMHFIPVHIAQRELDRVIALRKQKKNLRKW